MDIFNEVASVKGQERAADATSYAPSINSRQVQERLKKYTEMILMPPALNRESDTKSQLSSSAAPQLQPIQYDYLKRLIKTLEDEALEAHRIAKERKFINSKHDQQVAEKRDRIHQMRATYKDGLQTQIKDHTEARAKFDY